MARGNYAHTVWDTLSEAALDTQAAVLDGQDYLGRYGPVDEAMDRRQEQAYALLRASECPQARAALASLMEAEEYEAINEANVRGGAGAVERAEAHNRRVVAVAEQERVAARDEQSFRRTGRAA